MVNFSVFNELSLPLKKYHADKKFGVFFALLSQLKGRGLNQIRMSNDFKEYCILENTSFQKFIGQQSDRDFKTRLKSFVNNTVIEIDTPIIKDDDLEQNDQLNCCEYWYQQKITVGGLACCDIWNTLAISFKTNKQWDAHQITIKKTEIINEEIIDSDTAIQHVSKLNHLPNHQKFFEQIESENKLTITPDNFWGNKNKNFSNRIRFCPEVADQIKKLDYKTFMLVINILRDVEMIRKLITDFKFSGEKETVKNDPKLKRLRIFTVNDKKIFFENHIKSLPNGHRIYFKEMYDEVWIGYIGKHLPTKKY